MDAETNKAPYHPTVSVIVPVYNGAGTIAACLESVASQDYPAGAYEVIVVENGSTDDTTAIVERYPVRLLHSEDRGPAAARNVGLASTESEIVALTDADCIADPNWLTELVKPYADAGIGGVGGAILAYDHPDRTAVEAFSAQHSPLVNYMSGEHEYLPHLYTANASYRRELVARVGGFNARMVTADDVDLSWRIQLQTGAKVGYAPGAIVRHQHRSTRLGLAKQYRQYGFGEILIDTMYRRHPGYPRGRRHQLCRLLSQVAALPRYAASAVLYRLRLAAGRITPDVAAIPGLCWLVESSNIRGKLMGLAATRFMGDARPALNLEPAALIARFFSTAQR